MNGRAVSPRAVGKNSMQLMFDKDILINKDVNGIAITDDNTVLLALGSGTYGGLATLDIQTEKLVVNQKGESMRRFFCNLSRYWICTNQH